MNIIICQKKVQLDLFGDNEGKNLDGGKSNIVKILINKEYEYQQGNISCKLFIPTDSSANIQCIDLIENIKRTSIHPGYYGGVFELNGDNSRLIFAQTQSEMSNSPFIHLQNFAVSRIMLGNAYLTKCLESKNDKISIIGTYHGWGWGGSKAIVSISGLYYNKNDFIFDLKNNNIELIER